jgi:hypothetical protein
MRYKDFVKRALHWSGKISYKIPEERLKKLETTYRDSYLKRMEKELPEWVEDIKSRGYGFSGDLTEGMSTFEYTGLSDMLPKLYEVLPLINLPEDTGLKQDILRILFAHMKMHEDSVSALKVGLEEEKKKIDEEIASEREELKIVTNHMKKFRRRSGLKRRQVRRLKRDPINTDY